MIPVLTILTAIPAIAAMLALFAGKRAGLAKSIALISAVASLALALRIWFGLGTTGTMQFV